MNYILHENQSVKKGMSPVIPLFPVLAGTYWSRDEFRVISWVQKRY